MEPRAESGSTAASSALVAGLPDIQPPPAAAPAACAVAADDAMLLLLLLAILRPSKSRWGSDRGPGMVPAAAAAAAAAGAATWRCASWRCSSAARLGPAPSKEDNSPHR